MPQADPPHTPPDLAARRPLKSRDTAWARNTANFLNRAGVRPNTISLASILFGAIAGLSIWAATHLASRPWQPPALFALAILGVQSRLLCNLFDGMVAVEGGKKSPTGDLYNELPDRVADTLILLGAGYAIATHWGTALGWCAALLAMLTANVRLLGRAAGAAMHFRGLMAKQKRMATITAMCVLAPALAAFNLVDTRWTIAAALAVIILGCVVTVLQRIALIARDLNAPDLNLRSPK